MDALRKEGDSVGARINLTATGMPVGLGEPVFDRLEADIGHAMLSIGAVKAVEFGPVLPAWPRKAPSIVTKSPRPDSAPTRRAARWAVFPRARTSWSALA